MEKTKTKRIALLALMLALVIIFCFVPISFGTVTLALMILPVLIIAQVEDFKMTLALSVLTGVINQIAWYTTKATALLAPVFQNPMVCILPRILIGVVAWCVSHGMQKVILKPNMSKQKSIALKQICIVVSTALGVITNTGLVSLFTLLFFNNTTLGNGTAISVNYLLGWFGINFVIEIIAFSLLTPPIVFALEKSHLVYKKIDKTEILQQDMENIDVEIEEEAENKEK